MAKPMVCPLYCARKLAHRELRRIKAINLSWTLQYEGLLCRPLNQLGSSQRQCDLFLMPYANFFDMAAESRSLAAAPAANPFVDPAGCRNYIATFEERYNAQLKLEAEAR
jgi:hypothetical protein